MLYEPFIMDATFTDLLINFLDQFRVNFNTFVRIFLFLLYRRRNLFQLHVSKLKNIFNCHDGFV